MPSRGKFVLFQAFDVNKIHRQSIDIRLDFYPVTSLKDHSWQIGHQVNAVWGVTQLDDLILNQEVFFLQP
jgi:hypothetical protein